MCIIQIYILPVFGRDRPVDRTRLIILLDIFIWMHWQTVLTAVQGEHGVVTCVSERLNINILNTFYRENGSFLVFSLQRTRFLI